MESLNAEGQRYAKSMAQKKRTIRYDPHINVMYLLIKLVKIVLYFSLEIECVYGILQHSTAESRP